MTEFLVDQVQKTTDRVFVTGGVNVGSVCVGCQFVEAVVANDIDSKTEAIATALRVESIRAYGHNLDELPEGMTGELCLIGDIECRLQHGDFLRG
jgi:hypothetical protein